MLAYTYPLLDFLWTLVEIFLFVIWIWLAIMVFVDIFRSHDMGGLAKAVWVLFIIILPFIGILVYLIARGGGMHERAAEPGGTGAEGVRFVHQADSRIVRKCGRAGQIGRPQGKGRHHRRRVRRPEGKIAGLNDPAGAHRR